MVEERIDEAVRAENERLRAELTAARNEGDAIDQAHANETAKLRADLATERARVFEAEAGAAALREALIRLQIQSHLAGLNTASAALKAHPAGRAIVEELMAHRAQEQARQKRIKEMNDSSTKQASEELLAGLEELMIRAKDTLPMPLLSVLTNRTGGSSLQDPDGRVLMECWSTPTVELIAAAVNALPTLLTSARRGQVLEARIAKAMGPNMTLAERMIAIDPSIQDRA